MNCPEEVLCISTTWDKTTRKAIKNFCEKTLKKTPNKLAAVYCTVIDVKVSKETQHEAARYGVTLIPALRNKLVDPLEDPPGIHWLINHNNYYPRLRQLKTIEHVVGFSAKTKNAACVIHRSLFPRAKLYQIPSKPAALFVAHAWNKDELGLTGFHRTLVQDFCERKAKAGEDLKAYSTVIDVKISDDQTKDAESCGVTLISAQRREGIEAKHDPPRSEWLVNHESYYPYLGKIENVQYVIGYAPKTGLAAAYIREKLFPGAKLVLINHACPESNCLQVEEPGSVEFEEKMLLMASKADLVFSIGPQIHQYFQNAYRTEVNSKILSEIPHEEILPRPISCTLWAKPTDKEIGEHHIVTCGQIDTKKAIERCDTMAASIGTAANLLKASHGALNPPRWKIQGVSDQAGNKIVQYLSHKMQCPHIKPILYPGHSAKYLVRSLQQSHLCLPVPSYIDYSYYGMEAMVSGLPTAVDEDSHLAHFIKKHFMEHATNCIVSAQTAENNLTSRILKHIQNAPVAFKQAKALKKDLEESAVIATACARFTTLLTCTVKRGTRDENKDYGLQSAIEGKLKSDDDVLPKHDETSHQPLTLFENKDQGTKSQSETNTGDNITQTSDILAVKIGFDDSVLQEGSKERPSQMSQEQAEKLVDKMETALKRKAEELVADVESCKEVKKICKKILDDVDLKSLVAESLGILLRFLTLYNLYKLKQTCRCGSLAKAFEPLLVTDEMRQIAADAGIKLKLKATYDTEKFDEVELFFMNRDGGGIQPVKFCDEFAEEENIEDISFDKDDSVLKKDGKLTGQTHIDQKDPGQTYWSRKILYGHESRKPGRRLNDVRGLTFHKNQLLVCDRGNSIVRILNRDFTCQRVLGNFSGQFTKPFKPQSIAVSQDNLHFILDDNNLQIVVCDENDKVIRIITLPTDSNPWCIALVKGFIIVTEVKGHCILMYSQSGQYIAMVGSKGDGQTQFNNPFFVAVNSRDVIMVSDSGNHCIKCFDTDFNFLYRYGQFGDDDGQLRSPYSIAVDGADNVYACDRCNGRISMWTRDGTWRHHLFYGKVRYPEYIAVSNDGDRIVVY